MKFKVPIAMNISGFGIGIMGFIMPTYIESIKPYAIYLLVLGMCFIFIPWLFVGYIFFKNKKHNGRIIVKSPDTIHTNDPDLFPALNETALKKHIKKKIANTPFGEIISKISLYESNVHGFKYQLIVEAPEYHKGFSNIARNWETESPLEDDFSDIYRERPKDNYRTEWSCSVTDLEPQLQNALVVKAAKWILYKNHITLIRPPASQAG